LEEVQKVNLVTEEVEQTLVSAITSFRRKLAMPVGTPCKKRKLSPQKTSIPKILAFDNKQKKKKGLTTPEKQANERVKTRLAKLDEVMPLCVVCDESVDLQSNSGQKCSLCFSWCHLVCIHVCI
jgi:hypothetical protein